MRDGDVTLGALRDTLARLHAAECDTIADDARVVRRLEREKAASR